MDTLTEEQERFLELIKTTMRRNFFRKIMLNARQENQFIEIPSDVEWLRNQNMLLHEIHAETRKIEGVLQSIANIFKFGSGEMERHYPKQKRQ